MKGFEKGTLVTLFVIAGLLLVGALTSLAVKEGIAKDCMMARSFRIGDIAFDCSPKGAS